MKRKLMFYVFMILLVSLLFSAGSTSVNAVGLSVTNALSRELTVEIKRSNKVYMQK